MHGTNLFLIFLKPLNALGAQYMVTGSVAAMLYGEPRLTHDVDLVVTLTGAETKQFPILFPDSEFYCPPIEVIGIEMSRQRRGHFNLIHHETGFKADVYICGDEPLHLWAFERRKSITVEGEEIKIAPPEYVVIKKLAYFKEGGSEKHLRDISSMLRHLGGTIDRSAIEEWVKVLGLDGEWQLAQQSRA